MRHVLASPEAVGAAHLAPRIGASDQRSSQRRRWRRRRWRWRVKVCDATAIHVDSRPAEWDTRPRWEPLRIRYRGVVRSEPDCVPRSRPLSSDGSGSVRCSCLHMRARGCLPLSHQRALPLALACCWITCAEGVAMGIALRLRTPAHLLDVSEAPGAVRAPGVESRRARAQAV